MDFEEVKLPDRGILCNDKIINTPRRHSNPKYLHIQIIEWQNVSSQTDRRERKIDKSTIILVNFINDFNSQ